MNFGGAVLGLLTIGCSFSGAPAGETDAGNKTDGSTADASADAAVDAPLGELVTFRDGAGSYDGTRDTYIFEGDPFTDFGSDGTLQVDKSVSGDEQWGLLKFGDLFEPLGPIPSGATIVDATLRISVEDSGQQIHLHDAFIPWSESTTWASIGTPTPEIAFDPDVVESIPGDVGTASVTVRSSVARWAASPLSNHGWFLEPSGGNGVELSSREGASPPVLEVVYEL